MASQLLHELNLVLDSNKANFVIIIVCKHQHENIGLIVTCGELQSKLDNLKQ